MKKYLMLGCLFLSAFGWVFLMGLVGSASGLDPEKQKYGYLGDFKNDPSLKLEVSDLKRDKFKITLTIKVTDKAGNPVESFDDKQFEITEDGKPVGSFDFATEIHQGPIQVCMVIDYSQSMQSKVTTQEPGTDTKGKKGQTKLDGAKQAALAFLDTLRDDTDSLGLYFFNGALVKDKTFERLPMGVLDPDRRKAAKDAITNTKMALGTPMIDVMNKAMDALKDVKGRRVMIVMSDGIDTGKNKAQTAPAVAKRSQEMGIPLYMISFGEGKQADQKLMAEVAGPGGGQHQHAPSPEALQDIYNQIGESERKLQTQKEYVLEYESPNPVEDGSNRKVMVAMRQGDIGTRAKPKEYYVPGVISTGGAAKPSSVGKSQNEDTPFKSVLLTFGLLLGALFAVPYCLMMMPSGSAAPTNPSAPSASKPAAPPAKPTAPPVRKDSNQGGPDAKMW